jgi:predicted dehydrogenase
MGRWHAYYARRAGAEVAAIVDVNASPSRALQRKHPRTRVFADLAECLTACTMDAVHICTGVNSHVALAETALLAGKHVLVEKPIATSLAETEKLVSLARERRLQLTPVHQFPFQAGFLNARQCLGRLGDLVHVEFVICSSGGDGRTNEERSQILLEVLPHPYSLLYAILGEAIGQTAWCLSCFTHDELVLNGKLSGVTLGVRISLRGRPTRNELILMGTTGTAYLNLFHGYAFVETGAACRRNKVLQPFRHGLLLLQAAGRNMVRRVFKREWAYPGLYELIVRFYRSIQEGRGPLIDEREIVGCAAFRERVIPSHRAP